MHIYVHIHIYYTCTDRYTYINTSTYIYIYNLYLWVHVRNGVIHTSEPAGFEGHNNKLQLRTFQTNSVWIPNNLWKHAVLVTKWFYNSSIWMKKKIHAWSFWSPSPTNGWQLSGFPKNENTAAKPKFQAIIPPEKTQQIFCEAILQTADFFFYIFSYQMFQLTDRHKRVVRETSSNSYTTENERISPKMELFQKEMNHLPTIDLQGIFVTRSHLPLNLVPAAWFGICERGFG